MQHGLHASEPQNFQGHRYRIVQLYAEQLLGFSAWHQASHLTRPTRQPDDSGRCLLDGPFTNLMHSEQQKALEKRSNVRQD